MKKGFLFLLLVPKLVFAALAPLPQSLREMEKVLMYPGLSDFISQGDRVNQVIRVQDGYLVITNKTVIKAKMIYKKSSTIGPQKFSLEFTQLKSSN